MSKLVIAKYPIWFRVFSYFLSAILFSFFILLVYFNNKVHPLVWTAIYCLPAIPLIWYVNKKYSYNGVKIKVKLPFTKGRECNCTEIEKWVVNYSKKNVILYLQHNKKFKIELFGKQLLQFVLAVISPHYKKIAAQTWDLIDEKGIVGSYGKLYSFKITKQGVEYTNKKGSFFASWNEIKLISFDTNLKDVIIIKSEKLPLRLGMGITNGIFGDNIGVAEYVYMKIKDNYNL